jgi:methylmalonyl-CoA mutase cobalamin-binding subunit
MVLLRARGHRVVYLGARVPGPAMERAAAALDPAGVVVSLTMPESLERALEWMGERRRWSRSTPAWWGGPAVANAPDLAARLPGGLLAGSVDQGAAAVDATLARRR